MDAKERKLLMLLSDPEFCEFIDRAKLARSPYYHAILDHAAKHYVQHGDSTMAARVLSVMKGVHGYQGNLERFCLAAGATVLSEIPLRFAKAEKGTALDSKTRSSPPNPDKREDERDR